MSRLAFLLRWLHTVLGSHDFRLRSTATGYLAVCSCGAMIAKKPRRPR